MDALSRLLSLYPVRTAFDTRCCASAPLRLDYPAHAQGSAPYHLVVEGCAVLEMDGHAPRALAAGDMLLLPRGQAHRLRLGGVAAAPAPTDILCGQFHFSEEGGSALPDALPDIVLIRTAGRAELAGLQALVNLLRDEASTPRHGAGAVVSHLASALLALLLRAWLEQAGAVPGLFALLANDRLAPALNGILTAPERQWSMEQLARTCHMSRSSFMRLFVKVAATGPGELLLRVRMAIAAQSLRDGRRSIGDISEAAGYHSEAAFNRAFKRHIGVGPGAYRRHGLEAALPAA